MLWQILYIKCVKYESQLQRLGHLITHNKRNAIFQLSYAILKAKSQKYYEVKMTVSTVKIFSFLPSSEQNLVFVILLIYVIFPSKTYIEKLVRSYNSFLHIKKNILIVCKASVQIALNWQGAIQYSVDLQTQSDFNRNSRWNPNLTQRAFKLGKGWRRRKKIK